LSNVSSIGIADWFSNTDANQHVTPDLKNLDALQSYLGNDNLHVGDGKGLPISHIGHTKLYTPHRTFTMSNVLHVPYILKPLLFVQKFCLDSNVILNFTRLCFMSRISIPMKYSTQVRVKMVSML
jgi:histone deacetylase 1/2